MFDVIDSPRVASRPAWPNWPLSFAVALFAGVWIAISARYVSTRLLRSIGFAMVLCVAAVPANVIAQPPTPNTSGLPTGVARIAKSSDNRFTPNPADSSTGINGAGTVNRSLGEPASVGSSLPGPIGPGDMIEVSEAHTPEFHAVARVSVNGTAALPLIGEVKVAGMDESTAANVIADALVDRGMLLHPQVFVLVAASGAQNVSVLGEVTHPGEYAYGAHHRLLDIISAASGLSPTAGSLVYISHRQDANPAQVVALDPSGAGRPEEHNPELQPGDTVQVTRVGLVYVVGDVIRPGGFPLDPSRQTTVLQALSLAWGPSQNASLAKAMLIREQKGGRTVTVLNLKRMLRGKDPDLPVSERDIVFVPDSAAKNLWNRTEESVVQSAAGVSIYGALVYSQRF